MQKCNFRALNNILLAKLPFLLYLIFSIPVFGQTNIENLKKDLAYLASDSLKGRKTGSPEAKKSARYIAGQFKDIGLVSPDFTDDYLQEFTLVKSENAVKSMTLNGLKLSPEDFVVLSTAKSLRITDPSAIQVFIIGEHDDFMSKFSELTGIDESFMVLIHPTHKHRFERLKNYLERPKYNLGSKSDKFSIWVLSGEDAINTLNLNTVNKTVEVKGYNVIGELPAKNSTDRIWIYGAHYDHIGIQPKVNNDSIANGANDDASGVAAIIELARIFSQKKTSDKTLWFVAFAAEEMGLFGSESLAETVDIQHIEGMINIEMIGLPNVDLGAASAFISGYDFSLWPDKMSQSVPQDEFMFFPDPYPNLQLFMRSDNASFAEYGIAAHSISTYSESDQTYHQVSDEFENIDFENMKTVINAIYKGSIPLLQMDFNPGKINYQIKSDR